MNRILLVVISFLIVSSIFSQDGTFTIKVSNDSILMNNSFQVQFEIQNLQGKFEAPSFREFDVVGGPSTSSSYQMINGVHFQSLIYTYTLKPKNIGVNVIEPAYFILDNKTLETRMVEIQVHPNPSGEIQEFPAFPNIEEFGLENFNLDNFRNFGLEGFDLGEFENENIDSLFRQLFDGDVLEQFGFPGFNFDLEDIPGLKQPSPHYLEKTPQDSLDGRKLRRI